MDLKLTEHVRNTISLLYKQKNKQTNKQTNKQKQNKQTNKQTKQTKTKTKTKKTGEILIFRTFLAKNQFWPIFR